MSLFPPNQFSVIRGLRRDIEQLKRREQGLVTVQDEGIDLARRGIHNFVGDGVTATDTGTVTEINIPGGSGGIQFDVENDGNWLDIRTSDATGSTGHGMFFWDTSGAGIEFDADSSFVVNAPHIDFGPNFLVVEPALMQLTVDNASTNGRIIVNINNGSGTKFQIIGPGGVPVLEVRDDNTFHILTGASWVADL